MSSSADESLDESLDFRGTNKSSQEVIEQAGAELGQAQVKLEVIDEV